MQPIPRLRLIHGSFFAANAGLAYAAGNLGVILVSEGVAGDTTRIYHSESGTSTNLNGISAAAPTVDVAFAVGDTGVYFATMDGGVQWTRYPSYYAKRITSVTTWDGRFAVAASGPYTSLTRDGGKTWSEYRLRLERVLHSLAIAPGQAVFTVGERGFLGASTDSGKTWQSAFSIDGNGLVNVEAVAGHFAYAMDAATYLNKSSDGGRT